MNTPASLGYRDGYYERGLSATIPKGDPRIEYLAAYCKGVVQRKKEQGVKVTPLPKPPVQLLIDEEAS